jgi:hypothetical protein
VGSGGPAGAAPWARGRGWSWIAWTIFGVAVGAIALFAWTLVAHGLRWAGEHRHAAWTAALDVVVYFGLVLVGLLLSLKRPRNPVSWLFLGMGTLFVLTHAGGEYAAYAYDRAGGEGVGPGAMVADASSGLWTAGAVATTYVLLLFPDGRLPSPRWRWLSWATAASGTVLVGAMSVAVAEGLDRSTRMGADVSGALGDVLVGSLYALSGCMLAAAASLIVRFHRSRGTERLQLRWLAAAIALQILILVLEPLGTLGSEPLAVIVEIASGLALLALPAAVAIAVMRYRLYEIDRIISRTVSYATVAVSLGAVYSVAVLTLSTVVSGLTGDLGGDLAVAASTLLVAALFRPVRDRTRRFVDRRFDRTRYDAQLTAEAFGLRLRDEVDLDALVADLVGTATVTVAPTHATTWLAPTASRTRSPLRTTASRR